MRFPNNTRDFPVECEPCPHGMTVADMQGEGKENGFIFNIKE